MSETDQAQAVSTEEQLKRKLEEAYRALNQSQQRAGAMEALLTRLHAVAKHGSVRSGAMTYIRDELLKAFGEDPAQGDAHKHIDTEGLDG